ncbi:unnamed protein product [Mytilus edulis]|uniref:Uncharacterized protein n=1 Tax=Mytilus edulis TaxID=6550 RepID=A0A8S3SU80_MYTED|nr:unnamed protein product [Mytilus edulis]
MAKKKYDIGTVVNFKETHGRRWNRDIVRLCLTLWCRSPKGYTELRNSQFVILPSEKLLQRFKNTVNQEAGINNDMLHWMANEAKLKNIPPEGYEGGLIIDEMSIQQDLQLKKINGKIELIGFTELSPESVVFDKLKSNKNERILASHALQLVFLGSTGNFIEWNHFKRAYSWDISTHPFPVHHKLSQDHFYLTSEAKMRNHLAEDVLNADMYHLMKLYQQTLGESGSMLNATVKLLSNTSVLIANFRDNRAITDLSDDRLRQNHDVMDFFIKWEKSIQLDTTVKQKEMCMISHQTRQDIVSCILGFEEYSQYRLKNNNASVIPSRLNSDVIENVFCQQRTLHSGANTNPTYLGYCHAMNSVILGQTTVSRKSNTGGDTAQPPTQQNQVKV